MRTLVIDGNLGRDCEVRTSRDGRKYVKFSFANKIYVGGQEKSEWFDATCYDPYVVETQSKYLTKGTYVKVTGTFRSDVSVKDGKVYLNQYVQVYAVEYGGNGNGKKNEGETTMSTYTGGTPSVVAENTAPTPAPAPASVETPKAEEPTMPMDAFNNSADDDLPF